MEQQNIQRKTISETQSVIVHQVLFHHNDDVILDTKRDNILDSF